MAEYEKAKGSLKEYEIMIQKLNQEFMRLQEIIRSQKLKCEEFDKFKEQVGQHESELLLKIRVLQEEVHRLTEINYKNEQLIKQQN